MLHVALAFQFLKWKLFVKQCAFPQCCVVTQDFIIGSDASFQLSPIQQENGF